MTDECYLAAVREFGTPEAFGPDLARQLHFVYLTEAELFKECGLIGQAENGGNTETCRLFQAGFDQCDTHASLLVFFGHGHGFDFTKDRSNKMTTSHFLKLNMGAHDIFCPHMFKLRSQRTLYPLR